MLIGCNTLSFAGNREDTESIKLLAQAGFDSVDLNLNKYAVRTPVNPFWDTDEEARLRYAKSIAATAQEYDIRVGQVHSPYPTYFENEDKTADVLRITKSSISIAGAIGAPYMVIHPNVPPSAITSSQVEEAVEKNFGFFSLFFEDIKKARLCIGIENMFNWDAKQGVALPTVASSAECMAYMVDRLNELCGEKCFVACLDTGHAMLSGNGDPAAMARTLGSRLKLLHIHDNDGKRDKHLLPFEGIIDWQSFAKALSDIAYDGILSLEIKTDGDEANTAFAAASKLKSLF